MALLTISGEPASRWEEVAHCAAQLLRFELATESKLAQWITEEFGETGVPERAWRPAAVSVLARLAREHHLVVAQTGAELLFGPLPIVVRARVVTARRVTSRAHAFDVVLNAERMDIGQMAEVLRAAVAARGLVEQGLLSATAEAQLQFRMRLQLARHGIVPAGRAHLKRAAFGHPSEELFANLLDYYRIPWEYEPRSFPLQWDKDGNVIEAFTPDFYLPESDLYVELTTMKQALVTKKNRKVKLLRGIYPHINIQVFYQKDFQDLVSKYGLRMAAS
jgi:hypoxanthine phosphoribosyltransferase